MPKVGPVVAPAAEPTPDDGWRVYGGPRSLQTLLEYDDGHAPHGRFHPLEADDVGLGLAISF